MWGLLLVEQIKRNLNVKLKGHLLFENHVIKLRKLGSTEDQTRLER